jgi:hypothetical protein
MIMNEINNVNFFIILSDAFMLRTDTWVEFTERMKEVFVGNFVVSGNNLGYFGLDEQIMLKLVSK